MVVKPGDGMSAKPKNSKSDMNTIKNAGKSTMNTEMSGMICVLVSGILFGTMPLMTKAAYSLGSNAMTVAFGRFLTGAVFSGLYLLLCYKNVFAVRRRQILSIAILSIFFSAMPCLLYASYQYIDSGLATTLHFTYPIAVLLISFLVFGAGISRSNMVCIFTCLSGMMLLSQAQGNMDLRGVLLAVGSGVVYAIYITGVERSGLKEVPVLMIIFWLSLFSTVDILIVGLPTHQLLLDLPLTVWIPYTGLGLIAMVIAASLFQLGIMRCGSVKASMLSTVEPVTGVIIGILAFQECMSLRIAGGIALILLSVVVLVRK